MPRQEMCWIETAFPLEVKIKSESMGVTVATTLGVTEAKFRWIQVKDVGAGITYQWARETGAWSPSAPKCGPGSANLYIKVFAINIGVDGDVRILVKDDTGATLIDKTQSCAYNSVVSAEATVYMPSRNYGLTITVTP